MKKSVLVIDDETDMCELISTVLTKEGFLVSCAHSLAQAAEMLPDHPDIVLLDNNLPDGTGLEYLQMHPVDFMNSYIIMISADVSKDLQQKATKEGIGDFLSKPFSVSQMKEILKSLH